MQGMLEAEPLIPEKSNSDIPPIPEKSNSDIPALIILIPKFPRPERNPPVPDELLERAEVLGIALQRAKKKSKIC